MATFNGWSNTITAAGSIGLSTTNGAITMNSGTGTISIGTDATAATYNIATGAGAKVVTLGTTNTTSSLALKYGTADFTLASATGTVMSALDTGEITYPLQPAYLAYLSSTANNKTGTGTVYTLGTDALTIIYDQNSDFNTNGTFTAPVTGRYKFDTSASITGCTIATIWNMGITTSNRSYMNEWARAASSASASGSLDIQADMDAADTATATIAVTGEASDTDDVTASSAATYFAGFLIC